MHFVSASCLGEFCGPCYRNGTGNVPAAHKVEETIFDDEPAQTLTFDDGTTIEVRGRHPFTQYVCCYHFTMIMGPATGCYPERGVP